MIRNITIPEIDNNLRVVPKLFYSTSSQYVNLFFLLNTAGYNHYTRFTSL